MKVFNGHNWSKNQLQKPEDVPSGRHWQVTVFGVRSEYTPAYDRFDSGSTTTVPDIKQWAFARREDLERFLQEIVRTDSRFIFFEVPTLGKVQVKIETTFET